MSTEKEIGIEQVQEIYDMLTGRALPEGISLGRGNAPKLTEKKAFAVIWFLQEHLRILPDHIERCDECGDLFDTHRQGDYDEKSGKHWCGNCHRPKWACVRRD